MIEENITLGEYRERMSSCSYDNLRSTLAMIDKEKYQDRAKCLKELLENYEKSHKTEIEERKSDDKHLGKYMFLWISVLVLSFISLVSDFSVLGGVAMLSFGIWSIAQRGKISGPYTRRTKRLWPSFSKHMHEPISRVQFVIFGIEFLVGGVFLFN